MYIVTEQQNIAELLMMSDKNRSWTERLLVGCVAQWEERRSLAGELTLSCARPAADG